MIVGLLGDIFKKNLIYLLSTGESIEESRIMEQLLPECLHAITEYLHYDEIGWLKLSCQILCQTLMGYDQVIKQRFMTNSVLLHSIELHRMAVQKYRLTMQQNRQDEDIPEPGKYIVIKSRVHLRSDPNTMIVRVYKEPRKRNRTIDLSNGNKLYEFKSKGITHWGLAKGKINLLGRYVFHRPTPTPLPFRYMYLDRLMNIMTGDPVTHHYYVARVVEPGLDKAKVRFCGQEQVIEYKNNKWSHVYGIDSPTCEKDKYLGSTSCD